MQTTERGIVIRTAGFLGRYPIILNERASFPPLPLSSVPGGGVGVQVWNSGKVMVEYFKD